MRILADENIPVRTVHALRAQGHTVVDLRESTEKSAGDERVWALAQRDKALLVTTDKGFVRRRGPGHHGILAIRLRQPNRERIHRHILRALARFGEASWPGQTVVIRDRTQSVRRDYRADA